MCSLADNRPAIAGSIFCSQITGRSRMNPQAQIKSPFIGFGSLQRTSNRARFRPEGSQPPSHPASTFCLRSCGVGRHSSSQAADVIRARDRGTEPIMRHRPHSRWRSAIGSVWFGLVDPSVLPSVNEGPARGIDNAHGILEPSAALILQSQGEAGSSPRFKPRLPFDERPPR